MMNKKRNAVVQLSKDRMPSSDDEDAPAESFDGGMPMASQEELRKRKIVKLKGVKRPEPVAASQEEEEPPRPNLFGGIKLTAFAAAPAPTPAPVATPAPAPAPTPVITGAEEATAEEVKVEATRVSVETAEPAVEPQAPKASGFAAYSSSNPFAAVAAKQSPKSSNPYSSPNPSTNPFMSFTSGTNSIWAAAASKPFGSSQQIIQQQPSAEEDEGEDGKEDVEAEVPVTGPPPATAALFQAKDVELRTGEEDETCRLELRAKLYRFGRKAVPAGEEVKPKAGLEWFDVGVGPLRVLVPKDNSDDSKAARLVMRRETKPKSGQATKLLLNVLLKGHVTAAQGGERDVRLTCVEMQEDQNEVEADAAAKGNSEQANGESKLKPVAVSYMFRVESADKAGELLSTLTSLIPPQSEPK